MNIWGANTRLCIGAAALLLTAAPASTQDLEILHGVYVLESFACDDPPNAAILSWDGAGFSGAHSSGCTSQVERQSSGRYAVSTTCTASGDGFQSPPEKAEHESFLLSRLSATRFSIVKMNGHALTYRWCGDRNTGSD